MSGHRRNYAFVAVAFVLITLATFAFFFSRTYLFDKAAADLKVEAYAEAASSLKVVAYMGDSNAQRLMGDLYALGWGVPKDDDAAIQWYRQAGPGGERAQDPAAPAMYYIGRKYLGGEGIPRNEAEARKWLTRAARGGYAKASEQLADIGIARH